MPKTESNEVDFYSGSASYLYSSKIEEGVSVAGACELLVESEVFSFALSSRNQIFFKENGTLRSKFLDVEPTISGLGMAVRGHDEFISANSGGSNAYALMNALNLLLSDKKLFNAAFGFPGESSRIFMRPIAIRFEVSEEYEIFTPYFRLYAGGALSLSLSTVLGFKSATVQEVVSNEVNKSIRNIDSILCGKELLTACNEAQISLMPVRERVAKRRLFEEMIKESLGRPKELEFLEEKLTVYELVHTDSLTLSDVARNLLSVAARAIKFGAVRGRVNWIGRQRHDNLIDRHWIGKPIVCINSHSRQKNSSVENWASHRRLVDSVMTRVYIKESASHASLNFSDMRNFDDFNSFYSESVSLMLSSAAAKFSIEKDEIYTSDNLRADVQVLNEASHFLRIYYLYALLSIDRCDSAVDIARLEIQILEFEEALISTHKYGEVAAYMEEVKRGDHFSTNCKLLNKKIESVRKSLELDEKIASESYNRRITIIFGIIASATLSPELMQPLAKLYGITFSNDNVGKVVGLCVSVIVVIGVLISINFVVKCFSWLIKKSGM
jgi:hypothetical protein